MKLLPSAQAHGQSQGLGQGVATGVGSANIEHSTAQMYVFTVHNVHKVAVLAKYGQMWYCHMWVGMRSKQKGWGALFHLCSSSSLLGTSQTVGGPLRGPDCQCFCSPWSEALWCTWARAHVHAPRASGAMCRTSNCSGSATSCRTLCNMPTLQVAAILPMFLSQPSKTHVCPHFSLTSLIFCSHIYQGAVMCWARQQGGIKGRGLYFCNTLWGQLDQHIAC